MIRMLVEEPTQHQPDGVAGRLVSERPGRAGKLRVAVDRATLARQRLARVQVDRHAELGDPSPELEYRLLVKILHVLVRAEVGIAVHQGALQAQFTHRAFQLVRRRGRILQRHSRERGQTVRVLPDQRGTVIVCIARQRKRRGRIDDSLHSRRGEG